MSLAAALPLCFLVHPAAASPQSLAAAALPHCGALQRLCRLIFQCISQRLSLAAALPPCFPVHPCSGFAACSLFAAYGSQQCAAALPHFCAVCRAVAMLHFCAVHRVVDLHQRPCRSVSQSILQRLCRTCALHETALICFDLVARLALDPRLADSLLQCRCLCR